MTRLIPRPASILSAALIALALGGCASAAAPSPTPTAGAVPPAPTTTPPQTATPAATAPAPTPTLPPTPAPPPVESLPEIRLDVELFYGERWMRVSQSVAITNDTADVWDEVVFHVPAQYQTGSFLLDAVHTVVSEDASDEVPPFLTPTFFRVSLPAPAAPGEAVHIDLAYRVLIPPIEKTAWPPNGTTGWTPDLIQAGEWTPVPTPYVEGEGWATWPYHPVGDPTFYRLVNYTLTVRAEQGVVVASSGPIYGLGGYPGLGEDGLWHFRVERARGVALFASPRYAVLIDETDGVSLTSTYLPEHIDAARAALDIAKQSIALFEELYGPYPYHSLAIVENGFFGGMEYSALISITDYAYTTYTGEPPSLLHALVSHETAHQWWYGSVGNNQAEQGWLDETIAFYSELLYFERYLPGSVDWWWQVRVDQYSPHGPVDASVYDFPNSASYILLMYGQAARFMRDVREAMGDEAFFAFLRDYYAANQWQTVTPEDFFTALYAHTDADLTPIVATYFEEQGDVTSQGSGNEDEQEATDG